MCYCIVKAENWRGEKFNAGTKINSTMEDEFNNAIENQNELKTIAQEFNQLLWVCAQQKPMGKYCTCTLEVSIEGEILTKSSVEVPRGAEAELRKLLCHVQDFCAQQVEDIPGEINIVSAPAFFTGDIYEVVPN